MATGDSKLRLLYLMKILSEKTDSEHGLTMPEILSQLKMYGIETERKSIYRDIDALQTFGMNIVGEQEDRTYYYKVVSRDFELPELKLLVDSLQSARFISQKKSEALIKKLETLTSQHEAAQLNRQVFVSGRVKTDNEKLLYSVDAIHNAIARDSKLSFKYFQWDENKKKVYHNNGELFCVSPWAVTLSEENYYMIAYDPYSGKMKTYRIDKMESCEVSRERREGKKLFADMDIASYTNQRFRMYGGEVQDVVLRCKNSYASVIIDRFGRNIPLIRGEDEHFTCRINVAVSNQFISWVLSMNQGIEIIEPENVVERVRTLIGEFAETYKCSGCKG